jgi:hypothetical protein
MNLVPNLSASAAKEKISPFIYTANLIPTAAAMRGADGVPPDAVVHALDVVHIIP